jgi:hypothetical protein
MKVLEAFMAFVVTCRFEEPHIHGNLGIRNIGQRARREATCVKSLIQSPAGCDRPRR